MTTVTSPFASAPRERGFTLVELMVSLVVSSLVVLAATAFFISSTRARDTQDAASLLQDNARFLTEIITRNIQQVGYQNYIHGTAGAAGRREVLPAPDGEPDIRGYNNTAAGPSSTDVTANGEHDRSSNRINNSDTLVLRFQGSSMSTTTGSGTATATVRVADGSIIDCMGRPQPEPPTPGDRVYSIFEVQTGPGGEPELRCKTYNFVSGNADVQPIIRGVETFQLMYGVDTNADSFVDRWRNAKQVDTANQWSLVRAVRVGIVLRTPDRVGVVTSAATYRPLGASFSQPVATDPGSSLVIGSNDGRLRQVVTFTVNLRNQL